MIQVVHHILDNLLEVAQALPQHDLQHVPKVGLWKATLQGVKHVVDDPGRQCVVVLTEAQVSQQPIQSTPQHNIHLPLCLIAVSHMLWTSLAM